MKKIVFVIGSLSQKSSNLALAKEVEKYLENQAEIIYLDYKYIPYMNTDIEFPTPEFIKNVRTTIKEADGVWIFSPEYNFSYPAVLKNLLDWLSRPTDETGDRKTAVSSDVKVTLSSISGGNGANLKQTLAPLLKKIHMNYMDEPVFTSNSLDHLDYEALYKQADAFMQFILQE